MTFEFDNNIFQYKDNLPKGYYSFVEFIQHIPLHSAKSYIPGKELPYKVLDTIPNFSFPLTFPVAIATGTGKEHYIPIRNRERSPLSEFHLIIWCDFLCIRYFTKAFRTTSAPSPSFPFFDSKIPTFGSWTDCITGRVLPFISPYQFQILKPYQQQKKVTARALWEVNLK